MGSRAIGAGGYTDTAEGKVIAASFLDNYNNVIASVESNPNMNQFGAAGVETEAAGEVFAAGDVVVAKIDNVGVLSAPEAGAEAVTTVSRARRSRVAWMVEAIGRAPRCGGTVGSAAGHDAHYGRRARA